MRKGTKTMHRGMTRDELLSLPASVDLVTAGRAFDIGRTKAHEMARAGEFPVRLLRIGKQYRVVTAELLELLGIDANERKGAA